MITIENDKEVVKINIFLLISFQDKENKKDNIWKNSQRKSYKKSLNVLSPPPILHLPALLGFPLSPGFP